VGTPIGKKPQIPIKLDVSIQRHRTTAKLAFVYRRHHAEIDVFHHVTQLFYRG
jgi:hypothetical protein